MATFFTSDTRLARNHLVSATDILEDEDIADEEDIETERDFIEEINKFLAEG